MILLQSSSSDRRIALLDCRQSVTRDGQLRSVDAGPKGMLVFLPTLKDLHPAFHQRQLLRRAEESCHWTPSSTAQCGTNSRPSVKRNRFYRRPLLVLRNGRQQRIAWYAKIRFSK